MYRKILVATDGSTLSKKAVRSAIDLAGAVGAELVALYVVPRYPVSYFEGGVTVSTAEIARTEKQWADKGQAVVDAVRDAAEAAGVKAKAAVARSDLVAESILATAKKNKCDLVVMASHGRKGLKRILLGSETQHVLTHSTVPVLVLR
jgi:nucleotide-binding universal stress UspA family protein